jgi:hypothetical protein
VTTVSFFPTTDIAIVLLHPQSDIAIVLLHPQSDYTQSYTANMRQLTKYATIASLLFLEANAFTVPQASRQERSTSLNLLPGQGNLLKASYIAATFGKHEEEDMDQPKALVTGRRIAPGLIAAARSCVSRALSLTMRRLQTIEKEFKKNQQQDDVVLYPIVGFHFVQNHGQSIALPTTSHPACSILRNRDEEVSGWFSPACMLDLFAEDPCHEPN